MRVYVPATSANLGPGFDCVGIAWKCFDEFDFSVSDHVEITGCPIEYCNEENLAYKGYAAAMRYRGKEAVPVRIEFVKSDIPIARGLGSSAALRVGGIFGANELFGLDLSREEMLDIATELEGHPDNVAPAIYGGFTASVYVEGKAATSIFPVHSGWRFTAFIPDYELKTSLARSVLPTVYSRADAVQNIGCTAMLFKAMETGDRSFLRYALRDRIHEPYRRSLIPEYADVEELVSDAGGDGVCISGAGSTLLCFSDADAQKRILEEGRKKYPNWTVQPLKIFVAD